MKKIKLSLTAVVLSGFLAACSSSPKTDESTTAAVDSTTIDAPEVSYTINTDSTSKIMWTGEMLNIKKHNGTISFAAGEIKTKNGQLSGGNFAANLSSMKPLDANYDKKSTKEKLIGHLSSPDFFDVANHPTASFKITSVSGNTAKGMLTIRGKENEETLTDIVLTETNGTVSAKGKLVFNRQKYDVAFSMNMKDMVISDDIALEVELNGKAN